MTTTSIAINRFGYGLRADGTAPADGRKWLLDQFDRYDPKPDSIANAPKSAGVSADLASYYRELQGLRRARAMAAPAPSTMDAPAAMAVAPAQAPGQPAMAGGAPGAMTGTAMAMPGAPGSPPQRPGRSPEMAQAAQFARRAGRLDYGGAVAARAQTTLVSETPFMERLVHFWANHFAVSADKLELIGLSGTLEFEAIRPHVLGRFGDMLGAVERHPAMLLYLDQSVSVGPDSPLGARIAARGKRKIGLNENLAREIMELHTLGVRTGYTQADVTEFARAMTGWTVAGIGKAPGARQAGMDGLPGDFMFVPDLHQPGDRTIMGKRYPAAGEAQAQAVLADLAVHPATATHLSTKLARHFAGDTPPPALVKRLQAAFLQSGGDLPSVYKALIASPEVWAEGTVKFKTPWEWSLSTMRALGQKLVDQQALVGLLNQLGQPTWKPGQPIGYDDIAASWAGPDALMRRVEASERFAARAPATIDARALGAKLFPGSLAAATQQSLSRAESPGQALALLLVAPEMMRR